MQMHGPILCASRKQERCFERVKTIIEFLYSIFVQWREANPDLKKNIRDYATINELICLSNMENLNAVFIEQGMTQNERLEKVNQIAIHQMSVLESGENDRNLSK